MTALSRSVKSSVATPRPRKLPRRSSTRCERALAKPAQASKNVRTSLQVTSRRQQLLKSGASVENSEQVMAFISVTVVAHQVEPSQLGVSRRQRLGQPTHKRLRLTDLLGFWSQVHALHDFVSGSRSSSAENKASGARSCRVCR